MIDIDFINSNSKMCIKVQSIQIVSSSSDLKKIVFQITFLGSTVFRNVDVGDVVVNLLFIDC